MTKTYSELEGVFGPPMPSDLPCRKCQSTEVTHRVWESDDGGFVDDKYECLACGHYWWVEGADS